jgi:hypothetical protein
MNEADSSQIVAEINRRIDPAFEAELASGFVKVHARSATSRVFLVLSLVHGGGARTGFQIVKHRSPELTSAHAGKIVSMEWLEAFSQVNAAEATSIGDISWERIPADCEILKKTTTKTVVRDKLGTVLTLWKHGMPQVEPEHWDGTNTRNWERHTLGVTNWYYDSAKY